MMRLNIFFLLITFLLFEFKDLPIKSSELKALFSLVAISLYIFFQIFLSFSEIKLNAEPFFPALAVLPIL